MRLHGKGTGMKRRLRVWTRTIIRGLAVLLMLAVAECADAEPDVSETQGLVQVAYSV